jgi:hypothetical protein
MRLHVHFTVIGTPSKYWRVNIKRMGKIFTLNALDLSGVLLRRLWENLSRRGPGALEALAA